MNVTFRRFDRGYYTGETVNMKPHGKGEIVWDNGDFYEGDWVEGRRTSKGTFLWSNGDQYDGDFTNGKRTGKRTCRYSNGNRYEGDVVDGKRDGYGTLHYPTGDEYEGTWSDNRKVEGTYRSAKGDVFEVEGDGDTSVWTLTLDGVPYIGSVEKVREKRVFIGVDGSSNRIEREID